ncbi:MAG TPA: UbiH/UbiF/VisC/COQ6 family ubiquinone biosynthesis hydroxylase [Dongiaceae bacterium]|nr:UbiH/UbiF/VisC/COQ6 family ubiquinone biosynthesis hydroxylase [Dongiaceae bacterium]
MNAGTQQPDVLIVGAGMAGLTLACALGQSALRIIVIDTQTPLPPAQWPNSFDPRVSALTPASVNILRKLGVWDDMATHRVAAFTGMDVWDGDGTGSIQFDAANMGVEELGFLVENRITTHCLFERLGQLPNVTFIKTGLARITEAADSSVNDLPKSRARSSDSFAPNDSNGWCVTLTDGTSLQPRLLIGADGAQSRVRDQLGFRCRNWGYEQSAIVTTVTSAKPHDDIARQVFLETGPLAFLPLRASTNERHSCVSSIVWSLDTAAAKSVMALDDTAFRQQLARAFEHRLGEIVASDRRFSFPLTQNHAVDYVLPGVALIGDAAHTIHPLAGQGINLGFLDAAVLAEEILQAHTNGLPIDDFSVLRKYQRRRKPHNLMLMSAMEGFKRLFGLDVPPLRIARNLGMSFFNRHGLIKQEIMQRAMGLGGDVPALAQPGLSADF